jgi:hypothetical protein
MYLLSTAKSVKKLILVFVFACFSVSFISAQAIFRISKPIIGTTQICNGLNSSSMSYAFSSDVSNPYGFPNQHYVELSNENGLINPINVSNVSSYPNVVCTGSFSIGYLNLPPGNGYRIRVYFPSTPAVYGDYSDTFNVLASPTRPILNITGSVSLCPGTLQILTATNSDSNVTYQWQNYSSNIANATNTTYTATTNGSYSVKAIGLNGCSMSSSSVYVSRVDGLSSNLYAFLPSNYYNGNPLFTQPNRAFTLGAYLIGGKSPYNFTLSDGTTSITETNITYSKEYNLTSPATGSRTYTLTSVTDACGTQLTNSSMARVRINESNYCSASGQGTTAIRSFSIQGTTIINLNSGKSADGWGEFLTPANINANVNYNFTIASNNSTQKYFAIWADLNQNNTFESGEKIFPMGANNSYGQTITNSFTGRLNLPTTTYNGQVRMRVQLSDDSYSASYNCYSLQNGEVEDYILKVFNGQNPVIITPDSLPKLGVCKNNSFNLPFNLSGGSPSTNTTYKVEASAYNDFSYPITLGTGQTSPIVCNTTGLSSYWNGNYYIRIVPNTSTSVAFVKNNAPNQLVLKDSPIATLYPIFYESYWYNYNLYYYNRSISVANGTTPLAVRAEINAASSSYPVSIKLEDGRTFTLQNANAWSNNFIKIDSNITANGNIKYKLIQVSNNTCSNTNPDSIIIKGGTPYLKITKVFKGYTYNDTTSISKLCGSFQVKFAGDFLDSLYYKFYHVQISDANGSFSNSQDIGHICVYKILTEEQGGQNISCTIPSNLPFGNGYKLRVVKKTGNIVSPIYTATFEVLDPNTTAFTANLSRNVINEGEIASLNVNFSVGNPPYTVYVQSNNQSYSTTGNNTSLTINLDPVNSQGYLLSSYGNTTCGYSSSVLAGYVSVRTQDKDNSEWYVKPFQNQNYYFNSNYTKELKIYNAIDTVFKKIFSTNTYNSNLFNGYYDYNSTSLLTNKTSLKVGESYTIKQVTDTYGITDNLTGVWVDANQDGDFDDVGEELFKTSFTQSWANSLTLSITIPINTSVGFSRLRIRTLTKNNNAETFTFESSNPIERYGATFDIPIVILSNAISSIISTPKISGNTLCNGNSFSVDFSKYGIPSGTNATVELSDGSGNFTASPLVIGQGTEASIDVTLPMDMTSGNYKIRIVSNGIISPVSSSFNITTNQLTSMVDGDWHAGSTWSCGREPTYVDATTVAGGTTVTVFSGDARVGSIITNGVLSFLNGTTLQFRIP